MAVSTPRWQRRKDARPREIVEAALEVFAERGFAAARLDDVAARARVSKGTLYLYFPNKAELFKAVVRETLLPNLAEAEATARGFAGPTPALLATLITALATTVAQSRVGAIPKLVIAEAANFPDIARFYREEVIERGLGLIAALIRRGIERGEFRPVDPLHAARTTVAPLLFVALWRHSFERTGGQPLDVEAYAQTCTSIIIAGLSARPAGRTTDERP
jgi:AcrR family transcriptional regulator